MSAEDATVTAERAATPTDEWPSVTAIIPTRDRPAC